MPEPRFTGARDMIQVAIVDDHPLALRGIADLLAESGQFVVTAAVSSPAALGLDAVTAEGQPDVVILDLYHDGDAPCLEAISQLSLITRVLAISASARPTDVAGAVRAGAAGYVTKHADGPMLRAAVETVAAGGFRCVSRFLRQDLQRFID